MCLGLVYSIQRGLDASADSESQDYVLETVSGSFKEVGGKERPLKNVSCSVLIVMHLLSLDAEHPSKVWDTYPSKSRRASCSAIRLLLAIQASRASIGAMGRCL